MCHFIPPLSKNIHFFKLNIAYSLKRIRTVPTALVFHKIRPSSHPCIFRCQFQDRISLSSPIVAIFSRDHAFSSDSSLPFTRTSRSRPKKKNQAAERERGVEAACVNITSSDPDRAYVINVTDLEEEILGRDGRPDKKSILLHVLVAFTERPVAGIAFLNGNINRQIKLDVSGIGDSKNKRDSLIITLRFCFRGSETPGIDIKLSELPLCVIFTF